RAAAWIAMKVWLADPRPQRKKARPSAPILPRSPQRQAAAVARTTNRAFRAYTRWMLASAQKLGATASIAAPNAAAAGRSDRPRPRPYSAAHAPAAHAALNRLIRKATLPRGIRRVHSLPRST